MTASYIFWTGIAIVIFTYVGYPILLSILVRLKKRIIITDLSDEDLPAVTVVVAAYNEEQVIEAKIQNTLSLNYPKDKLKIIFVTDGSTDRSADIVRTYTQIQLFHSDERKGKIHAVNRVMPHVFTPVTVFCDANTFLNADALRKMVRHYSDARTGGVAGEKRIATREADNAAGAGEGMYWKYESYLKRKDAELYSIVGAAGELFSIRTELYIPPANDTIIEDFVLSMKICAKGYRFAYEPEATATETASASVSQEWKRKVRICAGGFQAMTRLPEIWNFFKYGWLTFEYACHRVLRWTLAPLSLLLIFISNFWLALYSEPFYQILFALQVCFYLLAFLGHKSQNRKVSIPGFFVPYYFVVMNAAVYAGFFRWINGKQSILWERAERASLNQ